MRTKVGLWIDHGKALIVAVTDKGEEIRLVISKVEKQPGRYDGIRSTTCYESQIVPADDSSQRKLTGHLNIYYDAVIACVRNAEFRAHVNSCVNSFFKQRPFRVSFSLSYVPLLQSRL